MSQYFFIILKPQNQNVVWSNRTIVTDVPKFESINRFLSLLSTELKLIAE